MGRKDIINIKVGDWVQYNDEKFGFVVIGEVVVVKKGSVVVQDFLCRETVKLKNIICVREKKDD